MSSLELKVAPYGLSRFSAIQTEGYAYVDKTRFIEELERSKVKYPFIVRPRRFGKSLFTSTLQAYYDIAAKEDFEKNFAGTYIASHKTPLANSYCVIRFDFSGIGAGSFEDDFIARVKYGLSNLCQRYQFAEGFQLVKQFSGSAQTLLTEFLSEFATHFTSRIYLIIDEYDQAANEVLAADVDGFKALTAAGGILKTFYSGLKALTQTGIIDWIYITGVTSISLDSMTSGFSIATNLSSQPQFAAMFGFTDDELRELVPQIIDLKAYGRTLEEIVSRMKELYNGYRFAFKSPETVFNASMCLYYLSSIKTVNEEPEDLLDPSVAPDISKIHSLLSLGSCEDVRSIVADAMARKPIAFRKNPQLLNLQADGRLDRDALLSSLVYLGYLTYAHGSEPSLLVPNRAVAEQFFEVYFRCLREFPNWGIRSTEFEKPLASLRSGDPEPLLRHISSVLKRCCGTHKSLHLRESDFQTALLIAANCASGFEYFAEQEVWGEEKGFADLLIKSVTGGISYLFELKYLTQEKASEEAIKKAQVAACAQLERYAAGDNVQNIKPLRRVAAVYAGLELVACDISE